MAHPASGKTSSGKTRSGWRFFPLALIGALALVIAVNAVLIWAAEVTYTGEVHHPYE